MKKSNFFFVVLAFAALNFQFSIFKCSAQYSQLLEFNGTNGKIPYGDLISDGIFLYGLTTYGGTNDFGTIFKIKPDGTGYVDLHNFSNTPDGNASRASLFFDGNFLYGMTYSGGANAVGTIFKIKPDGTSYSKLLDFSDTLTGSRPLGSLISDGIFLYGTTLQGGANNVGTIFKIKLDGTGFVKLLNFSNSTTGGGPAGSLIFDGTFLYGTTQYGGLNSAGTIFKIKPDGTGYFKILDFNSILNGKASSCSLITDGTFLYGTALLGGVNNFGTIFKIKPDGTGFYKLLDFNGITNGKSPNGSLISDGTFLYGTTVNGGTNSLGVIFKIMLDGTGYSKLLDFAGSVNGSHPYCTFISEGNFLYGMTSRGGTSDFGTIFKYDTPTGIAENNMTNIFNLYPNPNSGTFAIETKENNCTLIISNFLGENIYQSETKNQKSEIDLSKQPKGIYFVKIYEGKETHTKKIVVQ